jgi:hypothetical protein
VRSLDSSLILLSPRHASFNFALSAIPSYIYSYSSLKSYKEAAHPHLLLYLAILFPPSIHASYRQSRQNYPTHLNLTHHTAPPKMVSTRFVSVGLLALSIAIVSQPALVQADAVQDALKAGEKGFGSLFDSWSESDLRSYLVSATRSGIA